MNLNLGTWIAVYLPLFVILFIVLPQQNRASLNIIKKKRGKIIMVNELVKKYIGKNCIVATGSFGTAVTGEITAVEDNWIEVNTKKGARLLNADYVTNITEVYSKQSKI
jgi:hypothetical protein